MDVYVVRERIKYEGDNVYVVSAKDKEEARKVSGARTVNDISVSSLPDTKHITSDYQQATILWSNC